MNTAPPATLDVGRARANDCNAIWPLARAFVTSFTVERAAFDRVVAALFDDPRALLLVATTADEVIGYLLAHVHASFLANGPVTWAEELMVDSPHRAFGTGRALMDAAEQWAHDHGSAYVAGQPPRRRDLPRPRLQRLRDLPQEDLQR